MSRSYALALFLCSSGVNAQQPPLVGAWRITYATEVRIRNGVVEPVMSGGTLTVGLQGDSLVAQLQPEPSEDQAREPPLRLAAKADGEVAVFGSRSRETVSINGNEREVTMVATWTLRAKGDSLVGILHNKIEGSEGEEDEPQPVAGVRVRR